LYSSSQPSIVAHCVQPPAWRAEPLVVASSRARAGTSGGQWNRATPQPLAGAAGLSLIACAVLCGACPAPPGRRCHSRNIKNPNSFHGFDKEKLGMQTLATYYNISFL